MRYAIAILAILMLTGCSSKEITWNDLGQKTVTTRTNEDLYHEAQAKAWAGYFEALKNPPVIATIQQVDGSVLTINSQIPPPAPIIRQHQNQYIKPVTDVIKWGIGGVIVDRGLRAIVKGAGDTIVENSGDGTVYVDRSDSIASKTDASFSTDTDSSANDSSDRSTVDNTDNSIINQDDNSIRDSHDQTADPVIVMPEAE